MPLPQSKKIKNKSPAPIQITTHQILREARDFQEPYFQPPTQKITTQDELDEYRQNKRREHELLLRRPQLGANVWVKYAEWEASQNDLRRARSIWERALDLHPRNHSLWLKYINMEVKNGCINHARNLFERAIYILPRIDQLWYKYIDMEKKLKNLAGAGQIFQRWMTWHPEEEDVYEKFLPFKKQHRQEDIEDAAFANTRFQYEARQKEDIEDEAFANTRFQYEARLKEDIEDAAFANTRFQYEARVNNNPLNYDNWLDYVRLEENENERNLDRVRELYERAIANVPPAEEKRYWRRYIYLWINYALYEELEAEDIERARAVYRECLKLIPHKKFSFAKIWVLAAEFEIRQMNLKSARLILGNAIGKAPKEKLFIKYIAIEFGLGNVERCRKLYEKYLEWRPQNCNGWRKYAEFERDLGETERARCIYELAIAQPALDMPEVVWKAYIDLEISRGDYRRTRELYERLLERTKNLKVWISYATFESSAMEGSDSQKKQRVVRTRAVFERGVKYFKTFAPELKEERAMLVDEWSRIESSFGDLGDPSLVSTEMPKKLKRKRQTGTECEYEEYVDYVFPEDGRATNLKILDAAYRWKKRKVVAFDV